jgi:DME family drug/metabolite transporter
MSPVLVLAAEWTAGRRPVNLPMLGTVGLAVTGLTLLVGVPSGGLTPGSVLAGAGLSLLAAGGFATMTVVGARPVAGLDDLAATGLGFTTGAAVLAPLAAATSGLTFVATPASIGLLLLLGAGPTAVAYTLYFRGLRTTPAASAALMALLEPLVATALAVLVLGDRLSPTGLAGAALLITAVALDTRAVAVTPPTAER